MAFDWISLDGKLILGARIVRTFSYGFLSIILAIYLKLVGFNEIAIGIILTATLVNSVIFNLISGVYADKFGRKKMLILYAALMIASAIIFFLTNNYVALIIAALIGTINVTGSEVGAFLSLEQVILPQTVSDIKKRTSVFAIYNSVGTFAMAGGVLVSGLSPILENHYGLDKIDSIRSLFLLYAICSLAVLVIYFLLSSKIESQKTRINSKPRTLSKKSRGIIGKISSLFAVDAFAGGFVIQSIVSFWFYTKFGADISSLSYVFAAAAVLTGLSFLFASKLASKIGLVNTMVFTHIPSNVLIILLAFAPTFYVAILIYLARMGLSQMDVPTRQSYIVAIVNEDERITAASITNTSRNVAQSVSPSLSGLIIQALSLSAPFVVGGVLKIVYDVGIFLNFRKIKPPEEL